MRRWSSTVLAGLATAVLAGSLTVAPAAAPPAAAVTGADWDPGYIISDEQFFNYNAMSQADIQQFLNRMVPTCRATDPTLPCLKDLVTSTNTRAPQAVGHCTGYDSEGWESAARILWRVGQACRINPMVLIVMLQKEQSLITATAPTSWQYRAAMGADCPDTAPCAATTVGFFNQVYKAAWQMRQYTYSPRGWRHQIGPTSVLYSPNSACGSSIVNIRNQATVNLYNYTPYQPNAAALNNLYGLGDGCSTYGNRNFWRMYNDWFGSPTANGVAPINTLYQSMGGSSGVLGAATSVIHTIPEGGGTAQAFQNGSIYWTAGTGAHAVLEPERSLYFAYDGALGVLGWPASGRITDAVGYGQAFTTGSIYASPTTGVHAVYGRIRDAFFARGGGLGWMGYPIAEQYSDGGGTAQAFANGSLFVESNGWGGAVATSLLTAYANSGGPTGSLGWPRSDTVDYGSVRGQAFERGSIFGSTAGTYIVSGGIRDFLFLRGGATGPLGAPTGPASCASAGDDCRQQFQGGLVRWTSARGAWLANDAIDTYYAANGGATGKLGAPASEPVRILGNGDGFGQTFAAGSVYSSSAGTFSVQGAVRNLYWSLNGSTGQLGWPTGEYVAGPTAGRGSQAFQHGSIYVDPSAGTYVGLPAIEQVWWNAGGPTGTLGARASQLVVIPQNGGGHGQVYAAGSVYSSSAGTYAVRGGIRDAYFAWGGSAGTLGWPTTSESCTAGLCTQQFQGGTISHNAQTGWLVTKS